MKRKKCLVFKVRRILSGLGFFILIWFLSGCGNSEKISEIKPLQEASLSEGIKLEEEEIFYDDGTIEGQYSPWVDELGSQAGTVFTPKFYPSVLSKVRYFVGMNGIPATKFRVRVFGGTISSGPVESKDLLSTEVTATPPFGNKWVEIDLSDQNIVITSGDFFVTMVRMVMQVSRFPEKLK